MWLIEYELCQRYVVPGMWFVRHEPWRKLNKNNVGLVEHESCQRDVVLRMWFVGQEPWRKNLNYVVIVKN